MSLTAPRLSSVAPAQPLAAPATPAPPLPRPRGPLTRHLFSHLALPVHDLPRRPVGWPAAEDLQLALYVSYEIHYRGFEGVDAEWEWEPTLLAFRRRLERIFEARVTALTGP